MNPIQIRSRLRVWQRWGWLVICASLLVQWITGWTETTYAVILCVVSVAAIWFGWQGLVHLLHHLRLYLAGHVATATIVAYRNDKSFDERPYVPLVSFVTRAGEPRRLVPLTTRYETPPQAAAGVSHRGRARISNGDAPAIPAKKRQIDDRIGYPALFAKVVANVFCQVLMVLPDKFQRHVRDDRYASSPAALSRSK